MRKSQEMKKTTKSAKNESFEDSYHVDYFYYLSFSVFFLPYLMLGTVRY